MTITYELENSLYINITNRCSNDCNFCVRNLRDDVNGVDNLWLEREPTVDEIIIDITNRDLTKYDEIVFCGFGEPLIRYDDVLNVADWLKENHTSLKLRINTNGHGNLIAKRNITPEFAGKFDTVSISLNAKNAAEYDKICRSEYGETAYAAVLEFAKLASEYTQVILTVVDTMAAEDIEACREIAEKLSVGFRVREII